MRKLLIGLLLLLIPCRSQAAIAFLRGANSTGTATTCVITMTVNTGETIVVTTSDITAGAVSTVMDTGGSTYVKRGASASNTFGSELWSTNPNASIAATTITVTYSIGVQSACAAGAYSGVVSLGIIATPTVGTSTAPSIAITTQDNNNFVVAGMGATNGAVVTWASNVGNLRSSVAASVADCGAAILDNTSATPAVVTNTPTLSSSVKWTAMAMELRTVAASPGGGVNKRRKLEKLYGEPL